jgi:hypothetical protein
MNDFTVDDVVDRIEVRYVERAHGLDSQGERLIRIALRSRLAQALSSGTQRTENLCPVEPLPLAVVAETHGRRRLLPLMFYQIERRFTNQPRSRP